MAGPLATTIRPIFTFGDEGLIQYEKIAAKKLADIIENLELGEGANLQFAKQTYLPDDVARITYTVMEGILEPIIKVDIDKQTPQSGDEEFDEITNLDEEIRYYYIPSFWIGITTINHVEHEFDGNPNCGFEGYPPEGRLVGFEPLFDEGTNQAFGGMDYGYPHTVESYLGEDTTLEYVQVGDIVPGSYAYGDALSVEGFFGWQDWFMSPGDTEYIVHSENGMVATENANCYYTTPRDALRPLFAPEVDFTIFDDDLTPEFWHRSIIVNTGTTFGVEDINTGEIPTFSVKRPCVHIGSDPGDASVDESILWEALFDGTTIEGTVLSGEYEINAYAISYSCECFSCDVIIRLIIGSRSTQFEELNGDSQTKYQALMEIVDIQPENIGQTGSQARFYFRDLSLGGFGECDPDEAIRGGLNSATPGWWENAIYVNPLTGGWRIAPRTSREPFFDTPPCPPSPNDPPESSDCLGCEGDNSKCKGFGVCTVTGLCLKNTAEQLDVRLLASFSLARVTKVEAVGGRICQVQLVGNDGGQGGSCDPVSFSYESCNHASGIDPSIPLGSDLSQYPDQGIVGGWAVNELVVVIGWTNPCFPQCDGSYDYTGDMRWLVTKTKTDTDDFTSLFYQGFRCPGGEPFDSGLADVIRVAATQTDCGQVPSNPVSIKLEDGCLVGV